MRVQQLENIKLVFDFMEDEGIKLVSVRKSTTMNLRTELHSPAFITVNSWLWYIQGTEYTKLVSLVYGYEYDVATVIHGVEV